MKAFADGDDAILLASCEARHGNDAQGRIQEREILRLRRNFVASEGSLGFLNQIPAAGDTEFAEERGDVEFHGADRDVEAIGDFLVAAIAHDFLQDFAFARAHGDRAGKLTAEPQKIFSVARDAVDERVLRGDADEVILRQFTAHHTAEGEQTCGAAYGLFGIAIDFDLEAMRTGALVAENQEIWLARKGFLVIPGLLGVLG